MSYIFENKFLIHTYSKFWIPLNATSSCHHAKKFQQPPTWMEIYQKPHSFDSVIVFNGWNLHLIGRCYHLNLPLWKYVYFTSCPIVRMSLNCLTIFVNDDISHIGIFLSLFSSHGYVRFGHEHQPGSTRVFKELSP